MKKAGLWPIHVFCNILDRISSFVHLNEKFCNKNSILNWFCVVLIVSRILYCLCTLYLYSMKYIGRELKMQRMKKSGLLHIFVFLSR